MKRSRPPLHLARSPLVLVIGQVKISTIVSMERFIPEIQERLRQRGFPKFFSEEVEEVTLSFGPARQQQQVNILKRWAFQDRDSRWEIQVDNDTINVLTSQYERYDSTFQPTLEMALTEIHDVVGLQLVTRLGLRYVDVIRTKAGECFSDYLDERLLGLDAENLGVTGMLTRFHCLARSRAGVLSVRCTQMDDGSHLPPDLRPSRLKFDVTLNPNETVCFLDLDHFTQDQRDFSIDDVLTAMSDELHDTLDQTFREATTEYAMKQWGASEVK